MSLCRSISAFVVLVITVFLAFGNYEIWAQAVEPLQKPQKEERKPPDKKAATLPTTGPVKDTVPAQSPISIAEKNIFSPERKDFPATQPSLETPKPNLRPRVTLYGVAIAADYQSATISNPGRDVRKEERETRTLKIGEQIGEYKLAKILPDRIAMESNGDSFEVLLYDSQNPKEKKEVRAETKLATAANPQPAPASPLVEAPDPGP